MPDPHSTKPGASTRASTITDRFPRRADEPAHAYWNRLHDEGRREDILARRASAHLATRAAPSAVAGSPPPPAVIVRAPNTAPAGKRLAASSFAGCLPDLNGPTPTRAYSREGIAADLHAEVLAEKGGANSSEALANRSVEMAWDEVVSEGNERRGSSMICPNGLHHSI